MNSVSVRWIFNILSTVTFFLIKYVPIHAMDNLKKKRKTRNITHFYINSRGSPKCLSFQLPVPHVPPLLPWVCFQIWIFYAEHLILASTRRGISVFFSVRPRGYKMSAEWRKFSCRLRKDFMMTPAETRLSVSSFYVGVFVQREATFLVKCILNKRCVSISGI